MLVHRECDPQSRPVAWHSGVAWPLVEALIRRGAILCASVVMTSSAWLVVSMSPASADTPGCVTQQEFYAVSHGMRMARVHAVFDTRGRLAWRHGERMHRYYKICNVRFTRHMAVHAIYRQQGGAWVLRRNWADAQ